MHTRTLWIGRLAALAALFSAGVSATAGAPAAGIKWQSDLKKAQALAAKQKKIVMVDFYTDW